MAGPREPNAPRRRLTAEEIINRPFAHAFRGLQEDEVREWLRTVAFELERLAEREQKLSEKLDNLPETATRQEVTRDEMLEVLGEECERIVRAAELDAEEVRLRAEADADRILADAKRQAQELREAAADQTFTDQHAQMLHKGVLDEARSEGRALLREAHALRKRMLADLLKRRDRGLTELGELEDRRYEIVEALSQLGGALNATSVLIAENDRQAKQLLVAPIDARRRSLASPRRAEELALMLANLDVTGRIGPIFPDGDEDAAPPAPSAAAPSAAIGAATEPDTGDDGAAAESAAGTELAEGRTPGESTGPADSFKSAESAEPGENAEPAERLAPAESTEPAERLESAESTEPGGSAEPADSFESAESTEPGGSAEPADSFESAESAEPRESLEAEGDLQPAEGQPGRDEDVPSQAAELDPPTTVPVEAESDLGIHPTGTGPHRVESDSAPLEPAGSDPAGSDRDDSVTVRVDVPEDDAHADEADGVPVTDPDSSDAPNAVDEPEKAVPEAAATADDDSEGGAEASTPLDPSAERLESESSDNDDSGISASDPAEVEVGASGIGESGSDEVEAGASDAHESGSETPEAEPVREDALDKEADDTAEDAPVPGDEPASEGWQTIAAFEAGQTVASEDSSDLGSGTDQRTLEERKDVSESSDQAPHLAVEPMQDPSVEQVVPSETADPIGEGRRGPRRAYELEYPARSDRILPVTGLTDAASLLLGPVIAEPAPESPPEEPRLLTVTSDGVVTPEPITVDGGLPESGPDAPLEESEPPALPYEELQSPRVEQSGTGHLQSSSEDGPTNPGSQQPTQGDEQQSSGGEEPSESTAALAEPGEPDTKPASSLDNSSAEGDKPEASSTGDDVSTVDTSPEPAVDTDEHPHPNGAGSSTDDHPDNPSQSQSSSLLDQTEDPQMDQSQGDGSSEDDVGLPSPGASANLAPVGEAQEVDQDAPAVSASESADRLSGLFSSLRQPDAKPVDSKSARTAPSGSDSANLRSGTDDDASRPPNGSQRELPTSYATDVGAASHDEPADTGAEAPGSTVDGGPALDDESPATDAETSRADGFLPPPPERDNTAAVDSEPAPAVRPSEDVVSSLFQALARPVNPASPSADGVTDLVDAGDNGQPHVDEDDEGVAGRSSAGVKRKAGDPLGADDRTRADADSDIDGGSPVDSDERDLGALGKHTDPDDTPRAAQPEADPQPDPLAAEGDSAESDGAEVMGSVTTGSEASEADAQTSNDPAPDIRPAGRPDVGPPTREQIDAAVSARDEVTRAHQRRAARRAKGVMGDIANEALEAVRDSSEALLPSTGAIVERLAGALNHHASAVYLESQGHLSGLDSDPFAPEAVAVGARSIALFADRFERHVATVVESQKRIDPGAIPSVIIEQLRPWRTENVDDLVADILIAVHAAGSLASLPDGAAVSWTVTTDVECDHCTGAESGDVASDFGWTHPPAHPGCRCILVMVG